MSTKHLLAAAIAAAALAAPSAAHAVPEQLGFTARITQNGAPLTGSHVIIVRLHDAASGGAQVWTESNTTTATDGLVYLTLGSQSALDATVLDGGPLWIEVQVDGQPLLPRLPVTSAAYAVRAGVAEDAELLGGQPPTAFAAAAHNHTGTYLPVGASLACSGTQKVSAINPATGSVTCSNDVDTSTTYTAGAGLLVAGNQFSAAFAGGGVANTIARSDHAHTGTYLPVGAALICAANQKVVSINSATGSVTCATDLDTDTNTTYTAGNGLALTGTQFQVTYAGNGLAITAARSDHFHPETCPTGYNVHSGNSGSGSALCIKRVVGTTTWNTAASDCFIGHSAGQLCTYAELRIGLATSPAETLVTGHWLGDRTGDNLVLRVNGTNSLDFDEQIDVLNNPTGTGYYCCQRAH